MLPAVALQAAALVLLCAAHGVLWAADEVPAKDSAQRASLISSVRGFSAHRPTYAHPVSYSPDVAGHNTEAVFQISGKQRLFGTQFFLGYTQKSFWQVYDKAKSSPFRETNYHPEIFYRWVPERLDFHDLGLDLGVEHSSNGRSQPNSRSWNRVFGALFLPRGNELFYIKGWWRVPERTKDSPTDPRGDDNPDITDFYGHTEFHYRRQFGPDQQMVHVMVRANPATGRGALQINWSIPNRNNDLFWTVQLFQGYGDSLIDYDREITRLGFGLMLTR